MLHSLYQYALHFVKNEDGPTEIEYAVMLAAIVVVGITIFAWLMSTRTSASSPSAVKPARSATEPFLGSTASP